ncbi:MAG: response regulator [Planctomycetes bacterium]|nr:response regulator [Planctomycetota bacterium]
MSTMTAEKFAQRLFDLGLADNKQLDTVWGELGTRSVDLDEFLATALRREVVTNFQADRVIKGERTGYFYGKYKVLYLIGVGSFARVYRAQHVETGRVVAVKVLRKRYRESPVEIDQFLREGKVGASLRHINVVPIYEISGDAREPYMVMEFVEGQTLRDMVRIRKKLDLPTALRIMNDVLAGLQYAVDRGITHRDLKMSNVLVSSAGRSKLVDFGLAAAKRDDKELADCPNARAIDYAALERGTGVRKDDVRSDIFFAGCLLYHMISGRPPLFETKDRIQRLNISRFREIPPLSQLEAGTPNHVVAIVNRAIDLDPTKRYQSAFEMQREVQASLKRIENDGSSPIDGSERASSEDDSAVSDGSAAVRETLEGEGRTLMIIETNPAMQDLLRERLKKRGYRVLVIGDPQRAIDRFEDKPDAADCVLFSTTELEDSAVAAFNRFGQTETTRDVPCILLAHQNRPEWITAAETKAHRVVLKEPKLGELRAALVRLIRQASSAPRLA